MSFFIPISSVWFLTFISHDLSSSFVLGVIVDSRYN